MFKNIDMINIIFLFIHLTILILYICEYKEENSKFYQDYLEYQKISQDKS